MIRLTSLSQAESLRGKIPDLAIERMTQFVGENTPYYPDGLYCPGNVYDPDVHGYLIVIEIGDNIEVIPEAGERGLLTFLDDDSPQFEYICHSIEGGEKVYEAVIIANNELSNVFIIAESVITDDRLRQLLEAESTLNT